MYVELWLKDYQGLTSTSTILLMEPGRSQDDANAKQRIGGSSSCDRQANFTHFGHSVSAAEMIG